MTTTTVTNFVRVLVPFVEHAEKYKKPVWPRPRVLVRAAWPDLRLAALAGAVPTTPHEAVVDVHMPRAFAVTPGRDGVRVYAGGRWHVVGAPADRLAHAVAALAVPGLSFYAGESAWDEVAGAISVLIRGEGEVFISALRPVIAAAELVGVDAVLPADLPVAFRGTPPGRVEMCSAAGAWTPLPHVGGHSPTGFRWGYGGSGPADLAASLVAALRLPDDVRAAVKWGFVAQLGLGHPWRATAGTVMRATTWS